MSLSDTEGALLTKDRPSHQNIIYHSDGFLENSVGTFLCSALAGGGAGIVLATRQHLDGLAQDLMGRGLDLPALRAEGRYIVLDAEEACEQFMNHGVLDEEITTSTCCELLDRAQWASRPVNLYGEVVGLLAEQGDLEAAVKLEELWVRILEERPHAALCGYPARAFRGAEQRRMLQSLNCLHEHTISSTG